MHENTKEITELILNAARKARKETSAEPEPELTRPIKWPVKCTVGPGLEGAIACESRIGYVNGSKGSLIYRGYDIFDLCAYSTFEEVCYLLLHGNLPNASRLETFKNRLVEHRYATKTLRLMMNFPIEHMNAMAALRLGTNLMRQEFTYADREFGKPDVAEAIAADEDSIPMETVPMGEPRAIYEFKSVTGKRLKEDEQMLEDASGMESCYHLIGGVATIAAAIARMRRGLLPLEPDPELSHAANYLYMMTGRRPTPAQERAMDVALILHADHGMNASTFAAMVVASTLSDVYLSVGSAIAALHGPLHGGANEQVLYTLREIGSHDNVEAWFKRERAKKRRLMGFGHRVYKAYDPRARVLRPLAAHLAKGNKETWPLYRTARALEKQVVSTLGVEKKIFPNVDFFSGIVYSSLGIPTDLFTPTFAVSRVSGWTARVMEYLKRNRIFRPRAIYVGPFDNDYIPLDKRDGG